jgi:hypothetical protein
VRLVRKYFFFGGGGGELKLKTVEMPRRGSGNNIRTNLKELLF